MASETFLMLWNPGKFREFAGEIPTLQAEIAARGTASDWWSAGTRVHDIDEGDRIFLIRTAVKPWSVIASGHASGTVYHPARHSADEVGYNNRVPIEWDHVLAPEHAMPIPEQEPELYAYVTKRQASGNKLSPERAATLSRYWESHLRQLA
ncbi:hypothetical protein [Sinomonas flava]|uniref:Uncharacterized protein n=1 Tax=Sinomonas flava TaxID=496857 RepID=A0ABN3BSM9_9MICC